MDAVTVPATFSEPVSTSAFIFCIYLRCSEKGMVVQINGIYHYVSTILLRCRGKGYFFKWPSLAMSGYLCVSWVSSIYGLALRDTRKAVTPISRNYLSQTSCIPLEAKSLMWQCISSPGVNSEVPGRWVRLIASRSSTAERKAPNP